MTPENPRSQVKARNVTRTPETARSSHSSEEQSDSQERFRLMRLCPCEVCGGKGYHGVKGKLPPPERCKECRGEGRTLEEVATAPTEQAVGLALVQLGREGEFDECPFGLIDSEGEVGLKWLVRPYGPSPRNASDAGKLLRSIQTGKGNTQ